MNRFDMFIKSIILLSYVIKMSQILEHIGHGQYSGNNKIFSFSYFHVFILIIKL